MLSSRLPWDRAENALAGIERARRARGERIIDLTESNPTRAGIPYPEDEIRAALAPAGVTTYEPAPRGLPVARAAVADFYAALGAAVHVDQVVLTASSSESYGLLFKLLCDPGDVVLVPEPSYPLFEYLARLEGVTPRPYRLAFDGAWHLDLASLAEATADASTGRPRVVVVVNPNNPTGSFVKRGEVEALAPLCARAGLAVISDEVFAGYAFGGAPARVGILAAEPALTERALTFSLGGLSKSCGLPQLKLGWMAVAGPRAEAAAALGALELIADSYLSVATPVQLAAPRLLELGRGVRAAIAARVAENRARLAGALAGPSACTLLPAEGGWSAIVRVPGTRSDEAWASALLADDGVLVHPGYFFDLEGGTFLVLSLLPPPDAFADGIERVVARCANA